MCGDVYECEDCGKDICPTNRMRKKTWEQRGKSHVCGEFLCNGCWSFHLKSEKCILESPKTLTPKLIQNTEPNTEQELALESTSTQDMDKIRVEGSESDTNL